MKLTIATTFAAVALAGAAFAQQPPPGGGGGPGGPPSPEMQAARQAMREACAADMKANCADKQPGRETMMCMMQNQDKLSQGCKDAMAKMRAARQAAGGPGGR
jgi:hypothetical protein